MDQNKNPVAKRIAVKLNCSFASPALIGSGQSENTDSDILRDADERPFLPGSTIAGVLRARCTEAKDFFAKDFISPLWVMDAPLKDAAVITLDGVKIDPDNKVAEDQKKYDYEAISVDTKFTIRLLLTIRQNDDAKAFEEMLGQVIAAIASSEMAFGAKTHRGFGRVQCQPNGITQKVFDLSKGNKKVLDAWINFAWDSAEDWDPVTPGAFKREQQTLTATLALNGSIMIRDIRNIYEDDLPAATNTPDYKHLSVDGKPVIMGTSWAGAFRSGLYRLLKQQLSEADVKCYLDRVFGFVEEKPAKVQASQIIFDMSMLTGRTAEEGYRTLTRVKINRFTGGAADGALYTEQPWFGGTTTLTVRYPTEGGKALRELILLGLEALNMGAIQVGGETGVGRGCFKVMTINDKPADQVLGQTKPNLMAALQQANEKAEEPA
jgi:CRISPR/Cas system CSM-associated protein Csm3 (group 7 of RAMP superfamily)